MESYRHHHCIHKNNNGDEAIEALVENYVMDVMANSTQSSRLALAHSRKDVHALNQAIRSALRHNTETASLETLLQTEIGKRAFSAGDRIVFARNDKNIGVKNGILGTVQSIIKDNITVTIDGDPPRSITFNPKTYNAFDHGYAVTIHKSQGATVDHAYILASRTMDKHLAYVAMTRHKNQMRLYINERNTPSWTQGLDEQERTRQQLQQPKRKQRSGPSLG